MKPHLPTSLLSAVLAVFATVSTHAVEIPSNFEQIDVWTPDYLDDYSTLNSEDYVAFLLYMDSDFSVETMGTLTPSVSGGNIIIMSADADIPVKASFVDGFSFYNNESIKFDTLKQLSFDDSGYRTFNSGVELAITNVNDGDDSIADVVFNGNGGGYCAIFESHGSTVSITQNGGVLFSNYHNKWDAVAMETYPASGASGGAICSAGDIDISDNSEVVFYQNIAGETIDSYGIESQDMEGRCMFFTSMWQGANNSGGAVRAGSCTLHGNNNIRFESNSASHMMMHSTRENVCGSSTPVNAYGGALAVSGTLEISDNKGTVLFKNNKVNSYAPDVSYGDGYYACSYGGAIIADSLVIKGNESVKFEGNLVESNGEARGAAIYANGNLDIHGNDSVTFERNCEKVDSSYRLRSLYVTQNLNLSAKTGGYISFYDSVYVQGNSIFNAKYTDGNNVQQTAAGDIIFSGKYVEEHLNAIRIANGESSVANATEIAASKTNHFNGSIQLQGGTLQVVDGAILESGGVTVAAESSAKLLLRDGTLSSNVTLNSGSTMELQGNNYMTSSLLTFNNGAALTVCLDDSHKEIAALTFSGTLNIASLTVNVELNDADASGLYKILNLSQDEYQHPSAWNKQNITVNGSGSATGAEFGNLVWKDGVLYYSTAVLPGELMWENFAGTMVWSTTDANWDGGSVYRNGEVVHFNDLGAGDVLLSGDIAPASITVNSSEDFAFSPAERGGRLVGETGLLKQGSGELTLATANEYTGDTDLQEGAINVHHSTALGATAEGLSSVRTESDTTLRVRNDSDLVLAGNNNSIAGEVEIATGSSLEMKSGGYAASSSTVNGTLAFTGASAATADAGSLSGSGTVRVTDSQVSFASQSSFTGNLEVKGKGSSLNVASGSYTGAGKVSISGGTLTFGASADLTLNSGGSLSMTALGDAPAALKARNINVKSGSTLEAMLELEASVSLSAEEVGLGNAPATLNETTGGILNCTRLTMNVGSTLSLDNAHFDMNGGTLTLAVPKNATSKIELVLAPDAVYAASTQVLLFSNLGTINFIYDGVTADVSQGSTYSLNAADYFSGKGITANTELVFDGGRNVLYLQGMEMVPEPTTATLSLLALAALAARRRRK